MSNRTNNPVDVKRMGTQPSGGTATPAFFMLNKAKDDKCRGVVERRRFCRSGEARCRGTERVGGFTLLEVLTALAILGLVSSSVLLVVDRCVSSAADSALRTEAFRLARENMEQVLVRDSVEESVDYGRSEKYADVTWETVIEAFPEPVEGQMWIRAVCSAEYTDAKGERQKVELVHWIAALTDQQTSQIMDDEDLEQLEADQAIATVEEAAEYAGVKAETIGQWVENGLVTAEDGRFIKYNIDVFIKNQGNPSAEEKAKQVKSLEEMAMALRTIQKGASQSGESQGSGIDPLTGVSYEELETMDVGEVIELLRQQKEQ